MRYLSILLFILFFNFVSLQEAFSQNRYEERLNFDINDDFGFKYIGVEEDNAGNKDYYFEHIYESPETYYVVYINVLDPVYDKTDTQLLQETVRNKIGGQEPQRINHGDKIVYEYPTFEGLGDDNNMWEFKTGVFIYKKRVYMVVVSSRENQSERIYKTVISGIDLL